MERIRQRNARQKSGKESCEEKRELLRTVESRKEEVFMKAIGIKKSALNMQQAKSFANFSFMFLF